MHQRKNFVEETLEFAPSKGRVVDLGAGAGEQLRRFRERGYDGIGVDLHRPELVPAGIVWEQVDVRTWLDRLAPGDKFEVIFTRALLPFLEKPWVLERLLPELVDHLAPGGVLAIQTFSKPPSPPFEGSSLAYFSALELVAKLSHLDIPVQDQFEDHGPTTDGVVRDLWFTRVIVRAPVRR
jgi:SAM-dependent methyltransferase